MFEKATIIAAFLVFIIFSILGYRYYRYFMRKSQVSLIQQSKQEQVIIK